MQQININGNYPLDHFDVLVYGAKDSAFTLGISLHTGRQAGKQAGRQADQTDRQADRQMDRQTDTKQTQNICKPYCP